jgi:glycolate oxidase iron-sulfur subunit
MTDQAPVTDANQCMKCGFCMSTCPVYGNDHMESHVARGRNMLIREVLEGRRKPDADYRDALSSCLLCTRCEAVCPARVPSTGINLAARSALAETGELTFTQKAIHRMLLNHRSQVARLMGLSVILPGIRFKADRGAKTLRHLADLALVLAGKVSLPKFSASFLSNRAPRQTLPAAGTTYRGRVAFFPGCNYELFFSGVGMDVISALSRWGYEVVLPPNQTCCGLAVYNTGDRATAKRMAEHNLRALEGFDYVITGCATCGTALKGYGGWFGDGDPLAGQARALSGIVRDFSEFMALEDLDGLTAPAGISTVTYHDPCHLRWHQGVYEAPREIIGAVRGIKYIEMEMAEKCCGQGGSFGIKHPEASLALLSRKMESVRQTGARTIVTSCPGCTLQLMDGARRHGLPVEVVHISRLFAGK